MPSQCKNPWYPVPFRKGGSYRATTSILGHFDRIEEGTVLKYQSTGFSRYDGYIGFFFEDEYGKSRRWDIYDSLDPISEASKVFEEVQ